MRWFFFGSLLDLDVMEIVFARRVPDDALTAGILSGYRRMAVSGETFPALIADANASVHGILVEDISEEEARRICFFEGEEFTLKLQAIELHNGEYVEAPVFMATDSLKVENYDWDLAAWQALHKAEFLELARAWMAGYGSADFLQLDRQWKANQTALLQRHRRAG